MKIEVYLKDRYSDAKGVFDTVTKETVVHKGSKVSTVLSTSPTFTGINKIKKLRMNTVEKGILKEDISFKSPSSAANFVTGHSKNGYDTWKNKDGIILKELL